ncbi:AAEL012639-PA [Aedes aegypti]|uniref:AAEL012639-PA n=1 Tax=Aedes aegypti TaxID=7159 RepID=Q16LI3_AEDAE|nr:AAEL012639-PA [Aedes aegypti]
MKSSLISTIIVLAFGATLSCSGLVQSASIVVLVANGSDITINLPEEFGHNRLLNVVSNSGNNNPSVFDWIGGNGANKAPRLSIGGGNQGSNGAGERGGVGSEVIDALWKVESSTVPGAGREDEYVDSGESEEDKNTTGIQGTSTVGMSTTRSPVVTSGATRTTLNTWRKKYVTEAMNHPD